MPETFADEADLTSLARRVGTPFYLYSATVLRRRIEEIRAITGTAAIQARYAMKACSTHPLLRRLRESGLWIDAVSGNEVLRATEAGFPSGTEPPVILFTADVFRDNAVQVILEKRVLPNIGSPGMIDELRDAGYRGPIGVRLNPGFGHGHVSACDTGGPSSKHGIWHQDAERVRKAAARAGLPITLLHAHIGSGPAVDEFNANVGKLTEFFAESISDYPDLQAVNFGGGLPFSYRPDAAPLDLTPLGTLLCEAQRTLSHPAGRDLRIEIEPGRYIAAPSGALVTRITDVKETRSNDKGTGHTFVMVDAGFVDLVRPAMYGSYHHITVHGADPATETRPVVVAGPLCESGDVFTRDARELLDPRPLPPAKRDDLLILHDAGAYGAQMSSLYNSIGRAPQVWLEEDGKAYLASRRETVDDVTRNECFEEL